MTDREMIESRCGQEGLSIRGWSVTEDGDTASLGRFTVTTADFDDDGLYEGDTGELTACIAGSDKYHNRRVVFSFTAEGYDEGNEVRELYALDPADD